MGLNYREKIFFFKFRDTGPLIRAIFAEREQACWDKRRRYYREWKSAPVWKGFSYQMGLYFTQGGGGGEVCVKADPTHTNKVHSNQEFPRSSSLGFINICLPIIEPAISFWIMAVPEIKKIIGLEKTRQKFKKNYSHFPVIALKELTYGITGSLFGKNYLFSYILIL